MPRAVPGILVECDPSIKAIINKINDEHKGVFLIEDVDDDHVLVVPKKIDELKARLKDALKDTVREAEDSSSE